MSVCRTARKNMERISAFDPRFIACALCLMSASACDDGSPEERAKPGDSGSTAASAGSVTGSDPLAAALSGWRTRWQGFGDLPSCARPGDCDAARASFDRVRRLAGGSSSDTELVSALRDLAVTAEKVHVSLAANEELRATAPAAASAPKPTGASPPAGASATLIVPPDPNTQPTPRSGGSSGLVGSTEAPLDPGAKYARAARWAVQHLATFLRHGSLTQRKEVASAFDRIVLAHPNWSEARSVLRQALAFERDPELSGTLRRLGNSAGGRSSDAPSATSTAAQPSGASALPEKARLSKH